MHQRPSRWLLTSPPSKLRNLIFCVAFLASARRSFGVKSKHLPPYGNSAMSNKIDNGRFRDLLRDSLNDAAASGTQALKEEVHSSAKMLFNGMASHRVPSTDGAGASVRGEVKSQLHQLANRVSIRALDGAGRKLEAFSANVLPTLPLGAHTGTVSCAINRAANAVLRRTFEDLSGKLREMAAQQAAGNAPQRPDIQPAQMSRPTNIAKANLKQATLGPQGMQEQRESLTPEQRNPSTNWTNERMSASAQEASDAQPDDPVSGQTVTTNSVEAEQASAAGPGSRKRQASPQIADLMGKFESTKDNKPDEGGAAGAGVTSAGTDTFAQPVAGNVVEVKDGRDDALNGTATPTPARPGLHRAASLPAASPQAEPSTPGLRRSRSLPRPGALPAASATIAPLDAAIIGAWAKGVSSAQSDGPLSDQTGMANRHSAQAEDEVPKADDTPLAAAINRLRAGKAGATWQDTLGLTSSFGDMSSAAALLQQCSTSQDVTSLTMGLLDQADGILMRQEQQLYDGLRELQETQRDRAIDMVSYARFQSRNHLEQLNDLELRRLMEIEPQAYEAAAGLLGATSLEFTGWELLGLDCSMLPTPAQMNQARKLEGGTEAVEDHLLSVRKMIQSALHKRQVYIDELKPAHSDREPLQAADHVKQCAHRLARRARSMCMAELEQAEQFLDPSSTLRASVSSNL
jgi:hypothetical protein